MIIKSRSILWLGIFSAYEGCKIRKKAKFVKRCDYIFAIYNYSRITSALPRISCNFFSVTSDLFSGYKGCEIRKKAKFCKRCDLIFAIGNYSRITFAWKIRDLEKTMRYSLDLFLYILLLVITLALLLHEKFVILKKQCDIA